MSIDWKLVQCKGLPGYLEALQTLERNVSEIGAQVDALQRMATPKQRMEASWFQRYTELYRILLDAGMPPEVEGPAIGEWLRSRLASGGRNGMSKYSEPTIRATAYCLCGESLTLTGTDKGVTVGFKLWGESRHQGAGHGPTDKATCRRARERAYSKPDEQQPALIP